MFDIILLMTLFLSLIVIVLPYSLRSDLEKYGGDLIKYLEKASALDKGLYYKSCFLFGCSNITLSLFMATH